MAPSAASLMSTVLWVTGASSGIGAAFVDAAADRAGRIVGISRRPHPRAEHLAADLGDPASWPIVDRHVAQALAAADVDDAVFFHCAGSVEAIGPLTGTDADAYAHAVLVNAAAGQVLGRAFLAAAEKAAVRATLLMCSSPAATNPRAGLSHYSAGKAALEAWTRAVGAELGDHSDARVLCVIPHATDTPMVRALIDTPPQDVPLSTLFRTAAADRTLASPEQVAREIWAAIDEPASQGAVVHVGATGVAPAGDRR
jgi:benzil reductase ((S)-benzoin forming)